MILEVPINKQGLRYLGFSRGYLEGEGLGMAIHGTLFSFYYVDGMFFIEMDLEYRHLEHINSIDEVKKVLIIDKGV
jgi:hypothetical protein